MAGALLFLIVLAACSQPTPVSVPQPLLSYLYAKVAENPVFKGTPGDWDQDQVGVPFLAKFGDTYYMYYSGQRIGVTEISSGLATAVSPRGPWSKFTGNPLLTTSPNPAWDDGSMIAVDIIKEGPNYYMWYEAQESEPRGGYWPWRAGLATALSPRGPWRKWEHNPILSPGEIGEWDGIGIYVFSVVKKGGTFYLYYAGFRERPDIQGGIGLATAPRPWGPWTKYTGNPIMTAGPPGSWKWNGLSEPRVLYYNGLFQMWYAGVSHPEAREAQLGYAYSSDGINWNDRPGNPILNRGGKGSWDEAFATEAYPFIEGDSVYLYYGGGHFLNAHFETAIGLAIGREQK